MKPESKPTPGPWEIHERFPNSFEIQPKVAWLGDFSGHRKGENKANAELIAEAGTVYHETGLTPREILARKDELLDELVTIVNSWHPLLTRTAFARIDAAIAKAKGEPA